MQILANNIKFWLEKPNSALTLLIMASDIQIPQRSKSPKYPNQHRSQALDPDSNLPDPKFQPLGPRVRCVCPRSMPKKPQSWPLTKLKPCFLTQPDSQISWAGHGYC